MTAQASPKSTPTATSPLANSTAAPKAGKLDPTGKVWIMGDSNTMEFRSDGTCVIKWSVGIVSVNKWAVDGANDLILTRDGESKGRVIFEDATMTKGTYMIPGPTPSNRPMKLKE